MVEGTSTPGHDPEDVRAPRGRAGRQGNVQALRFQRGGQGILLQASLARGPGRFQRGLHLVGGLAGGGTLGGGQRAQTLHGGCQGTLASQVLHAPVLQGGGAGGGSQVGDGLSLQSS